MNLIDQVKQIKIDHPDWGRRKISAELGVSEKRVRMVLESLRTPNENGIRSIRHYNQQSIIDAVVHLKDVNDRDEILRAVKLDPAKWDCVDALVRTLPTGTKRTDWTKRKGYHSVRRFQVFSYTEDGLRAIYYV